MKITAPTQPAFVSAKPAGRTPRPDLPPPSGQAPDALEYFRSTVALPDGLFTAPPDVAAQPADRTARLVERAWLAGVALVLGLLAVLIVLAAA